MTASRPPIGDEHIDRFLDRVKGRKSEGTWKGRHTDLKQFHNWIVENEKGDVTDLSAQDIDSYLTQTKNKGYAPHTVERHYHSIRALYRSLGGYFGVLNEEDNPLEDFEYEWVKDLMGGSKKTEGGRDDFIHITPEEVDLMVENAPKPRTRNQLMFRLLFQTGVRAQECRDIRLEDVSPAGVYHNDSYPDGRAIDVYSQKTDEWRTVCYQPSLDTLMSLWLNQIRETYAMAEKSEYLFLTNRSEKLGRSRIQELVRETAEEAGIQKELYVDPNGKTHHRITPHAFRHGHCMHAVKQDIDIAFVSEHAGHSSLNMTKRYLEAIDSGVQNAYKRFES
ncbi:MAG TPA: tyrosine-type recombinase/integrase [Halococcus sp.]|nr:tyrosine-type recombinase/integrase [Halococcus sp.]